MSRNFEKQMARIMPKSRSEPKESPFANFKRDWILSTKLEKTIYIAGFFAILWKLFDIIFLGRWL